MLQSRYFLESQSPAGIYNAAASIDSSIQRRIDSQPIAKATFARALLNFSPRVTAGERGGSLQNSKVNLWLDAAGCRWKVQASRVAGFRLSLEKEGGVAQPKLSYHASDIEHPTPRMSAALVVQQI